MSLKVLSTLGPSSMSEDMVRGLTEENIYLFQINLSHTPVEEVEGIIKNIQSWTDATICHDSQGAQIRNHRMKNEAITYAKGDIVKIHHDEIIGDKNNISFTPHLKNNVLGYLTVPILILFPLSFEFRFFPISYIRAAVQNGGLRVVVKNCNSYFKRVLLFYRYYVKTVGRFKFA